MNTHSHTHSYSQVTHIVYLKSHRIFARQFVCCAGLCVCVRFTNYFPKNFGVFSFLLTHFLASLSICVCQLFILRGHRQNHCTSQPLCVFVHMSFAYSLLFISFCIRFGWFCRLAIFCRLLFLFQV